MDPSEDKWFPGVPRSDPGKLITLIGLTDDIIILLIIGYLTYLIIHYF